MSVRRKVTVPLGKASVSGLLGRLRRGAAEVKDDVRRWHRLPRL
jgi:hypothetical protein